MPPNPFRLKSPLRVIKGRKQRRSKVAATIFYFKVPLKNKKARKGHLAPETQINFQTKVPLKAEKGQVSALSLAITKSSKNKLWLPCRRIK